MISVKTAVIDIGSNSIRYFCAAAAQKGVAVFAPKQLITTRLAEGILTDGALQDAAIERSIAAIETFLILAREQGAKAVYAYATSAVRDAKNRGAFLERLQARCGLAVDVLSGEEEARLAYLGATGHLGGGLIDIGGGSAQAIIPGLAHSFPIGCVRAKDLCSARNPAEYPTVIRDWLDRTIQHTLSGMEQPRWTGVGGTITTLGALQAGLTVYDSLRVNAQTLTPKSVRTLFEMLLDMGEARKEHPLLLARHDIILFGALILLELMQRLKIHALHVSDADGMEGYLMDRAGQQQLL